MDDWDTVTKIGSKTRGGGAVRETVVRGKGALNAAARSGSIVATEKKFATGNAAASTGGSEGQRMTKVDRSDEIIKPKTVGRTVGQAIQKRRGEMTPKLTAKELGAKVAMNENDMKAFERGDAPFNSAKLQKLENVLKIKLLGDNIGAPKEMGPKKKAPEKK